MRTGDTWWCLMTLDDEDIGWNLTKLDDAWQYFIMFYYAWYAWWWLITLVKAIQFLTILYHTFWSLKCMMICWCLIKLDKALWCLTIFYHLYAWWCLITLDDLSFEIYLVCVPVDTPADNTEGPLPNDLVHLVDVIKQYLLLVRHILRWLKPGRQLGCCSLGGLTLEIGLIFLVIIFKILFGKCWLGQITAWHK